MKIAIVSGYFAVPHRGHLELFKAALEETKEHDHYGLVAIIVNNDWQTEKKYGFIPIDSTERCKMIQCLHENYDAFASIDKDESVARSIERLVSYYSNPYFNDDPKLLKFTFYNSGDRSSQNANPKEIEVCQKLGIDVVYLDLPKVGSSSELIKKISDHAVNRFLDRDIDAS